MRQTSADEEEIFTLALEKSLPEERARFLDSTCGHDIVLRKRVEKLLGSHEGAHGFLRTTLPSPGEEPFQREKAGLVIGRYKLLEQIGEGGFGIVFMAEQTEPVRRTVALKILKPGMDSRQVVARFEAERQALALMDHPGIARVLDGGETLSGRPYLVMDLVRGEPITNFCAQQKLTARARLHLFLDVCEAVQHAHRKGIIHRDLKPSNVLGALEDNACMVKVIDFGIVKALGPQLTDNSASSFANMIGTPAYMSPEQAGGNSSDIDTRSDIYSLGVLLYELLTGATPFDKQRLHAGYDEMRRILREEEPPRPSQRLSTLANATATISTQPPGDARQLSLLYKGELDWIVMKALEKDRNRRYETAGAFAADVQRYLRDEPVEACPPSTWYRCRKFARRNRAPLAMACVLGAAFVFAVAALAGSIGWALNDRAVREAAVDNEVEHSLAEARTMIEQAKWQDAQAALERGRQLLSAAGRPSSSVHLVKLQADLDMARQIEALYGQSSEGTPSLASVFGNLTSQQVDPIYAKAFREYGIDLSLLSEAEAARRIRESSIRLELARALDFWSSTLRRADEREQKDWRRLVAIAMASDPDPWRNQLRGAIVRKDQKRLEEMATSVDERLTPPRSLLLLANALDERNLGKQAAGLLRKAHQQYPGDLWINDALGWSCRNTAPEEALHYFTAALALRPDRWQSWCKRAEVYHRLGQLDKASADLSRALVLNPTEAEIWLARAATYAPNTNNALDEIIRDTSMAISLNPKLIPAYLQRGTVFRKLQQWERAIADYDQVLAIDNREYAWYFRGECHAALGHWDIASHDLDQSLQMRFRDRNRVSFRLTPMRDEVWLSLCCYRAAAGDSKGHRIACEKFLSYYGDTKKPLEACRIALSFFLNPQRAGPKDPPVRLAAFATASAPKDLWCSLAQGAALYRMGQYAQSIQRLEQVEKSWTQPSASDAGPLIGWLYLSMAHQQLGHAQQGRIWLRMATQRMDQEVSAGKSGPLRLENNVWAMCLVLRREAEGLVRLEQVD